MIRSLRFHRLIPRVAAVLTAVSVFAGAARADSLWVSSAKGEAAAASGAMEYGKVKLTGIHDGILTFTNISGRETERSVEQVVRIAIDDEPSLNAAEESYIAEKWEPAVENYVKTLKTTKRDWLKDWVAKRLLVAAEKANRFDAAAMAYITAILGKSGTNAAKPAMPDPKSTYLANAVTETQTALQGTKLSADQRQALLSFLLDLHRTRNDQKGMQDVMQQMVRAGATASNDPAAAGALARMKLDVAGVAVDGKQYKKAIDEINANKAIFVDPRDQAAALYVLAQAQEGLAGDDATALQDAALAYMRVVAQAKDVPGKPHVVDSLMKTASILERTKDNKAALELYQQVAAQFAADPAAAKATENAQRLNQQSQAAPDNRAPATVRRE